MKNLLILFPENKHTKWMSCISITIGIYVVQRKTSCPRRQQILLYKLGVAIACQDKAVFVRTRHTKKEERNSDLTCRILKLFLVSLCVGDLSWNPLCLPGSRTPCDKTLCYQLLQWQCWGSCAHLSWEGVGTTPQQEQPLGCPRSTELHQSRFHGIPLNRQ